MQYIKQTVNAKPRTLSATWTTESVQDLTDIYTKIRYDQLSKDLSAEFVREHTFDIKKTTLEWEYIKLPAVVRTADVTQWCNKHLKGEYYNLYFEWLIERPADATWFRLRWYN